MQHAPSRASRTLAFLDAAEDLCLEQDVLTQQITKTQLEIAGELKGWHVLVAELLRVEALAAEVVALCS